jgi:hypothetical protein
MNYENQNVEPKNPVPSRSLKPVLTYNFPRSNRDGGVVRVVKLSEGPLCGRSVVIRTVCAADIPKTLYFAMMTRPKPGDIRNSRAAAIYKAASTKRYVFEDFREVTGPDDVASMNFAGFIETSNEH